MIDNNVIISGLGVISALGVGVNENLNSLMTLKSGIGPITLFQTNHDVMVGEVKLGNTEMIEMLSLDSSKRYSRTALLGLIAAREAFTDSGFIFLNQHDRMKLKIGVISSTSVGGMDVSENFYREYRLDKSKGRLRDLIGHDCGSSTKIIADYLKADDFVSTVS
ncbi:MAG TPA: beta-ketoacyl synthase N-terminal-like domain-containing protein, partial [Bacteroidales bacterium]|nr:beta-ketoacyl synthase N-terminal-like domain-containing protein [Bacteroidales bacterium]